jgi:prevent-host-death family protein
MKSASITETKNQLSALLEKVKAGEVIVIYDRKQPVARLTPVQVTHGGGPAADWDARLQHLERRGLVRRPAGSKALPREWFSRRLPKPAKGSSVVEALLKDREEGR